LKSIETNAWTLSKEDSPKHQELIDLLPGGLQVDHFLAEIIGVYFTENADKDLFNFRHGDLSFLKG
jgi:hypothetical protein